MRIHLEVPPDTPTRTRPAMPTADPEAYEPLLSPSERLSCAAVLAIDATLLFLMAQTAPEDFASLRPWSVLFLSVAMPPLSIALLMHESTKSPAGRGADPVLAKLTESSRRIIAAAGRMAVYAGLIPILLLFDHFGRAYASIAVTLSLALVIVKNLDSIPPSFQKLGGSIANNSARILLHLSGLAFSAIALFNTFLMLSLFVLLAYYGATGSLPEMPGWLKAWLPSAGSGAGKA